MTRVLGFVAVKCHFHLYIILKIKLYYTIEAGTTELIKKYHIPFSSLCSCGAPLSAHFLSDFACIPHSPREALTESRLRGVDPVAAYRLARTAI
jgi:hypothetical protein